MKKQLKSIGSNTLLITLGLLLFTSCEKDLHITPPPFVPQLTISTMVCNQDSGLIVFVGKNKPIFELDTLINGFQSLKYTQVALYKNGVFLDSVRYKAQNTGGDYSINFPNTLGEVFNHDLIELKVSHPAYPTVRTSARIPIEVPINQARFIANAGTINEPLSGEVKTYNGIEINFTDPAQEDNYYEVILEQGYTSGTFTYYDKAILPEAGDLETSILFSDKDFNGQNHQKIILFDDANFWSPLNVSMLRLTWRCISKEKYIYMKSFRQFQNANSNAFAEPANIYGNIQNGLGLFSIDNQRYYPIQ